MNLNQEQQQLVADNMGLVGKVIHDKVHNANKLGIFSYEDIYQIGCIGLCKAAFAKNPECFSAYAYRLIWNEICTALIYANRRSRTELLSDSAEVYEEMIPVESPLVEYVGIEAILERALKQTKGVTAKGIQAIRLYADGYNSREIGEIMGTSANNVTAWISKARKYLRALPELAAI